MALSQGSVGESGKVALSQGSVRESGTKSRVSAGKVALSQGSVRENCTKSRGSAGKVARGSMPYDPFDQSHHQTRVNASVQTSVKKIDGDHRSYLARCNASYLRHKPVASSAICSSCAMN